MNALSILRKATLRPSDRLSVVPVPVREEKRWEREEGREEGGVSVRIGRERKEEKGSIKI